MTSSISALAATGEAATRLGNHPQDHGWRNLYRLFAHGISLGAPELSGLMAGWESVHPSETQTHLITLLGIALKRVATSAVHHLSGDGPIDVRLQSLECILAVHGKELTELVSKRRNSFTGARRFLVPQVLLSAYFGDSSVPCTFADLGTGLGVLPRQLNSRRIFHRHAAELPWHCGVPAYTEIPLVRRYGVDRGPMPDFEWVQTCYGPSAYYDALLGELEECFNATDDASPHVVYEEVNLLNLASLSRFIRERGVNAVNISYVLYQIDPRMRTDIIDTLRASMLPPGLLILTEPHAELGRPGCSVLVFEARRGSALHVCDVSDGHFRGRVEPGTDFIDFARRHPIAFVSAPGILDSRPRAM